MHNPRIVDSWKRRSLLSGCQRCGDGGTTYHRQEEGCYCEGGGIEVIENYEFAYLSEEDVCPHCKQYSVEYREIYLGVRSNAKGVAPPVIRAYNEGGHNSTSVCLLCVLEIAKKLGCIDDIKTERLSSSAVEKEIPLSKLDGLQSM